MDAGKFLVIRIYKQFFTVLDKSKYKIAHLETFNNRFNTYAFIYSKKDKRYKRVLDKQFVGYSNLNKRYRYPINTIKDFSSFINSMGLFKENIDIKVMSRFKPVTISINMDSNFKPIAFQKPIIKEVVKKDNKNSKLVNIQTGKGKTVIACNAITKIKQRTLVLIKPKYISKWIDDFIEKTNVTKDEIFVVRGRDSINKLIKETLEDEAKYKIIITSSSTIRNFIKDYEVANSESELSYDCIPQDFTMIMGIGTILIDEAHEEFYNLFKILLYFDVELVIGLSATMLSRDKAIRRLHHIIFPKDNILQLKAYHKYSNLIALAYGHETTRLEKASKGAMGYSHILYEEAIMNDRLLLLNYLDLIYRNVLSYYVNKKKQNEKCAVYVSSVRFATLLTEYLSDKFKGMDVRRYVEDDPYDNVINADLRVSTLSSSGTAIDMPKLQSVIMTVNTMSDIANLQVIGRLREIVGSEVYFVYLWCKNVSKHVEYHQARLDIFDGKVKTCSVIDSNLNI